MKKIIKLLPIVFKILFFLALIVGVGIDAYYKFGVPETGLSGDITLGCYLYFCFYLGVKLSLRIIKIKNWIFKLLGFVCLWAIAIIVFNVNGPTNEGLRGSVEAVIVFTTFFAATLLTLYFIYLVFFKNFRKFLAKSPRLLFNGVIFWLVLSTATWFYLNRNEVTKPVEEAKTPPVPLFTVQAWQLNSRYKINKVIKLMKVDLDKDGKEELAAITSYDKFPDEIFYYAGFYRYNPATEKWDEFYADELSVLNYGVIKEDTEASESADFVNKLIDLWSNEFTSLSNIGDVTRDGYPEIVFSALVQGKYLDKYLIVAQAGESHFYYKIFWDQNSMATLIAEDGLLIEKYGDEKYDYKLIFEWDEKNLQFKLIESQKSPVKESEEEEKIKINPIWEEFSV